tara:strand:+ start:26701 stop:27903 length:1203 start_codon:yes stop_codon:yes gene_type:complete
MRATPPIDMDSTKLTTPAVAEPYVPAAYAGGTTYGFGDIVAVDADYATYESLKAANTGNTPLSEPNWWRKIGVLETVYDVGKLTYALGETCSANNRIYESLVLQSVSNPLPVLPEIATAFWLDVGPTMRYAMFDLSRNTQTVGTSPMTVVVTPAQRINTVGLVGMAANEASLKVTSVANGGIIYPLAYDATKVYNKYDAMTVGLTTIYECLLDGTVGQSAPNATYWKVVTGAIFDLNTREVYDAYTYSFEPFSTRPTKVVIDIPAVSDAVITVVLTSTSGNVKLGGLVIGSNYFLGKMLKPARNVGVSFSTVDRDLFGNANLVKRKMLPKLTGTLLLDSALIDAVTKVRSLLDAEPALYTGIDTDGDWTNTVTILGVHQQFDIETTEGQEARIAFSAEEI